MAAPGSQPSFRRMSEAAFRSEQWERRYEPHIAPINQLVDELRAGHPGHWMPYVSADYGGIRAEVLVVFQDPGPGTNESHTPTGSGFLCNNNDDPSADLFSQCLWDAGLDVSRVITWNAFPWYIPKQTAPTARQLDQGVTPLHRLLALLPDSCVVVLSGRKAQDGWARFRVRYPATSRPYVIVNGLHTSGRGITNGGQHSRNAGIAKVTDAMRQALQMIENK